MPTARATDRAIAITPKRPGQTSEAYPWLTDKMLLGELTRRLQDDESDGITGKYLIRYIAARFIDNAETVKELKEIKDDYNTHYRTLLQELERLGQEVVDLKDRMEQVEQMKEEMKRTKEQMKEVAEWNKKVEKRLAKMEEFLAANSK